MIYANIFNTRTLNIFTDASIKTVNNVTIGCPGCLLVETGINGNTNIFNEYYTVEYNSTNNNSEYKAIMLGIQHALLYKDKYDFINLFSDSKVSVYGLREWLYNWTNVDGYLYGSSGIVSNQDIICRIIHLIYDNNLRINLYHQKGHVTESIMKKATDVFKVSNNLNYVEDKLIRQLSFYNDYVDKFTKKVLDEWNYTNGVYQPIYPICKDITNVNLSVYSKLLGRVIK